MSYDIRLYDRKFLKEAIENDLGDWTNAAPIAPDVLKIVRDELLKWGYTLETERESHCEFEYSKQDWGLQATIFPTEIAFTIPYWDSADAAIRVARAHMLELSERTGLGFYDPQTGEASI